MNARLSLGSSLPQMQRTSSSSSSSLFASDGVGVGSADFFADLDLVAFVAFVAFGSEGAGEEEAFCVCWPFVALPERRISSAI
jgi:hypothetical protein